MSAAQVIALKSDLTFEQSSKNLIFFLLNPELMAIRTVFVADLFNLFDSCVRVP